jgi:sugar/nucleoside kinase (ribokinase family)
MKPYRRFGAIVGAGGIGAGMLFLSEKAETLGRSESRPVVLSRAKDYCKQHIVLHYAAVLARGVARTIPIGAVGSDAPGLDLLALMGKAGMETDYIDVSESDVTMLSVCLQYPDKESCNITATNNAARRVTPEYLRSCMERIGIDAGTIVVALPEIPVESRCAMLKAGKDKNAFTALSIAVAEASAFLGSGILSCGDLLAVNEEEARALLGVARSGRDLAGSLHSFLSGFNPGILLLMTCGKNGAYTADRGYVEYIPSLPVEVVSTAGAGDAFLGGALAGLALGLPFQKRRSDERFGETRLESAAELGALCAGMSVEVEDSIAFHVNRESVQKRIRDNGWESELGFDIRE